MTELLTAAGMAAIERAAIEGGEVTGLELMERAGRGVVEAIFEEWPAFAEGPRSAVVLCGPGNNGGDGFVVARLLKERGWAVEVVHYGDPAKLPADARTNYDRWCALGPTGRQYRRPTRQDAWPTLRIDALFGTGLRRGFAMPPEITFPVDDPGTGAVPPPAELIAASPKRVAVDLPSGLCADSGRRLRDVLPADLTVTFHRPKPGHYLAEGEAACGKVRVVDIGLAGPEPAAAAAAAGSPQSGPVTQAPSLRLLDGPVSIGKRSGHKYHHGHALVLGGGPGKGGAARLAARGALRVGAGLATLGCPPAALQESAAQLNAIMLRPVRDAGHLAEVLADERLNALCLGPGFGLGERTRAMVAAALAAGRPTVLDGDALTSFAENPPALFALTHATTVLTPHAGEFKRLFPDIAEALAAPPAGGPACSKVDATREAAARAGCVVLHKGPDTVIADPAGRAAISAAAYERAAPWLATAGSGDVLAGFVTGLLARGLRPMEAAETAAWLHVECALDFGPGLIAEDLPERLPAVFRKLGF